MIKDIIDKFMLRTKAPSGRRTVEHDNRDNADTDADRNRQGSTSSSSLLAHEPADGTTVPSVTPIASSRGDGKAAVASSQQIVQIRREDLMELLGKSRVETFGIPADLLKRMGWRESAPASAPKPEKAVMNSFERKFDNPSIVIEIVDSDNSDVEENDQALIGFPSLQTNIELSTEPDSNTFQNIGTSIRSEAVTSATFAKEKVPQSGEDAAMIHSTETNAHTPKKEPRSQKGMVQSSSSQIKQLTSSRSNCRKRVSSPSQLEAPPLASSKKVRITSPLQRAHSDIPVDSMELEPKALVSQMNLVHASNELNPVGSDNSDMEENELDPLGLQSGRTNVERYTEPDSDTLQSIGTTSKSETITQVTCAEEKVPPSGEDAAMTHSTETDAHTPKKKPRRQKGMVESSPWQIEQRNSSRNGGRKRLPTPSQLEAIPLASNKKVRMTSPSQDTHSDIPEDSMELESEVLVSQIDLAHASNELTPSQPLVDFKSATADQSYSTQTIANQKKSTKNSWLLRQLSTHLNPGILSVCHKPRVFPPPSNFSKPQGHQFACFLTELLQGLMPDYAAEIPSKGSYPKSLMKQFPDCIVDPRRVERGYFKAHLSSNFANHFASFMPDCIRIKRTVSKKGIAFISTIAATLSDTHYDQDTSFLLMLTGTKEVFYAPPSMVDRLRVDHPVISHSSIFEEVNPFVAATGTSWQLATLQAGDGLLLPQGWIHAIKSLPGTLAISFQVESSGIDATSPYVRRSRNANPEDLRNLSHIVVNMEENGSLSQDTEPLVSASSVTLMETPSVSKDSDDASDKEDQPKEICLQLDESEALMPQSASFSPGERVSSGIAGVASGLPTKAHVVGPKLCTPQSSLRRSRREKLECGVAGCKRTFPVDSGLMWVMVLSLDDDAPAGLPVVPSGHPKHLICFDCHPQAGEAVFAVDEVLNETDMQEIGSWDRYCYYAASRADYEKWATHSGENGRIHAKMDV